MGVEGMGGIDAFITAGDSSGGTIGKTDGWVIGPFALVVMGGGQSGWWQVVDQCTLPLLATIFTGPYTSMGTFSRSQA